MSVALGFRYSDVNGSGNGNGNGNSSNKQRSSPLPPKSPDSVTVNPGFGRSNRKQRDSKKGRGVLEESSRNGASNQVKSPIPPRPLSRRSSRSKQRKNKKDPSRKSSLQPSIWRFDVSEEEEEEEKKEELLLSTRHVLVTSHSYSPELAGPSQNYEWQLPTQKSHRRAQSWDAGDYSLWLSSNQTASNWSEEQEDKGSDIYNAYHENLKESNKAEETNYQQSNDPRPRLDKSRETFQQLRQGICMARQSVMVENSWANYKTLAQLLHRLAGLYFENGEFLSAQATLEDALEMYQHVLACTGGDGRNTCLLDIADIICNLGSIELQYKNFELAIARFTEALDLQKRILGGKHPKVIASLDNLGYSLSKRKSYDQALVCYKDMFKAQLLHYETFNGQCYESLGKQLLMYEKLNDCKGATKAAKRALEKALNAPKGSGEYIEKLQRLRSDLKAKSKWWRR
ncbi:MAG: hypothetical protein SGBAC_011021 [Bacillariaceae sp.]